MGEVLVVRSGVLRPCEYDQTYGRIKRSGSDCIAHTETSEDRAGFELIE
jgi:hypothetical protein